MQPTLQQVLGDRADMTEAVQDRHVWYSSLCAEVLVRLDISGQFPESSTDNVELLLMGILEL